MGAAGYVTFYDRAKFEEQYAAQNPSADLATDWWYLDTITAELDGRRVICDYADDQGMHEGIRNDFWFGAPNDLHGSAFSDAVRAAQERCEKALIGCQIARVEVWT